MEKVVLILEGISTGKNIFIDTIKSHNYWVWNASHKNVLGMISHKLGYFGDRDSAYYEFINDLKELADKYFNFERNYTLTMIDKFMNNEKANVLIIHNIDPELAIELKDFYGNVFDVLIVDNDVIDDSYDKTLNYRDDGYVDNVLHTMEVLTKSFSKNVESNSDTETEKEIE
jgi:hypothetical protein